MLRRFWLQSRFALISRGAVSNTSSSVLSKLRSSSRTEENAVISRSLHVTHPVKLHPLIVPSFIPLSKLGVLIVGRIMRKWYQTRSKERRHELRQAMYHNWHRITGFSLGASALVGLFYGTHLETCPITHRRRFIFLKPKQMEKLCDWAFQKIIEEDNVVPASDPLYRKTLNIANRLLQSNQDLEQLSGKDWTITVLDKGEKGAAALPNGNILISTKEHETITSDDDVMGIVLAHEIAHCILRHRAEAFSFMSMLYMLMLVPLVMLWFLLPGFMAFIVVLFLELFVYNKAWLPYSRMLETEADEVGLALAAKACIDIREAPAFWAQRAYYSETLSEEEEELAEAISTHPLDKNRQKNLLKHLPQALKLRSACGCYPLAEPDPNVPGQVYTTKLKYSK